MTIVSVPTRKFLLEIRQSVLPRIVRTLIDRNNTKEDDGKGQCIEAKAARKYRTTSSIAAMTLAMGVKRMDVTR